MMDMVIEKTLTPYNLSEGKKHSTRKAFGETVLELARSNPRLLAVTGDLTLSVNLTDFEKEFPERFINFGVAEQNMVASAAGMAIGGMLPFVATFASFLTLRSCEQVRNDCSYADTNVKLVGANAGISGGPAGPTHHSIEDLAMLRAMPNIIILTPADSFETRVMVKWMAEQEGPMYLRLGRDPWPLLHSSEEAVNFRPGGSECFCGGDDVTIFAIGNMVAEAILASEELSKEGIHARVVSFFTLKPIDREAILAAARQTGALITIEDHNVIGGLGSAVAEVAVEAGAPLVFKRLGIPDEFSPIGSADDLYARYKMDAKGIMATVREVLAQKQ